MFDPSLEYTRSSTNRLVFRGIELIPGIQIGLIEATDADRDTFAGTASLRYGVTNRLEIEGRVPYLYGATTESKSSSSGTRESSATSTSRATASAMPKRRFATNSIPGGR